MIKILALISWHLVILFFNYIDRRITRSGGKPNYLLYFIWRGAAAILHGAFMLMVFEDAYTNYGTLKAVELLLMWAPYLIFQVCTFWIQYEICRNHWSGEALLYYDQQEGDSGIIDRFFKWTGPAAHAFFKLMALVLAILSAWLIWVRH